MKINKNHRETRFPMILMISDIRKPFLNRITCTGTVILDILTLFDNFLEYVWSFQNFLDHEYLYYKWTRNRKVNPPVFWSHLILSTYTFYHHYVHNKFMHTWHTIHNFHSFIVSLCSYATPDALIILCRCVCASVRVRSMGQGHESPL